MHLIKRKRRHQLLLEAVSGGNVDDTRRILEDAGRDRWAMLALPLPSPNGDLALHVALDAAHYDVADLLLEYMASAGERDAKFMVRVNEHRSNFSGGAPGLGFTVGGTACFRPQIPIKTFKEVLRIVKPDLSIVPHLHNPSLYHLVAHKASMAHVAAALDFQPSIINVTQPGFFSPLFAAVSNRDLPMVRFLLARGALPCDDTYGNAPPMMYLVNDAVPSWYSLSTQQQEAEVGAFSEKRNATMRTIRALLNDDPTVTPAMYMLPGCGMRGQYAKLTVWRSAAKVRFLLALQLQVPCVRMPRLVVGGDADDPLIAPAAAAYFHNCAVYSTIAKRIFRCARATLLLSHAAPRALCAQPVYTCIVEHMLDDVYVHDRAAYAEYRDEEGGQFDFPPLSDCVLRLSAVAFDLRHFPDFGKDRFEFYRYISRKCLLIEWDEFDIVEDVYSYEPKAPPNTKKTVKMKKKKAKGKKSK